jgi:hypothetical protein
MRGVFCAILFILSKREGPEKSKYRVLFNIIPTISVHLSATALFSYAQIETHSIESHDAMIWGEN